MIPFLYSMAPMTKVNFQPCHENGKAIRDSEVNVIK